LYNIREDFRTMDPQHDFQIPPSQNSGSQQAADLIRQKLDKLYSEEPNASQELTEAKAPGQHSKHQKFMLELTNSGKSLAQIQTEWHAYYQGLPDHEKHQVWQEFYAKSKSTHQFARHYQPASPGQTQVGSFEIQTSSPARHSKKTAIHHTVKDIKHRVTKRASASKASQIKFAHHLRSLIFGFGMGFIVVVFLLFGFFNERFVTPFITPSRTVSSTPIITDASIAVGPEPKIIIPKINVEGPVVYDQTSIEPAAVEAALEDGILHYAITANPGEIGNAAFFGHSSNNLLNKGKYKFVFLLLKSLVPGDTFYIQKDGKRYVYKVFDKKIVPPTDVSVLDPVPGHPATATLITCDPPGLSTNRLIIAADQISPDPTANVASTAISSASKPATLPSNAPSLWSRIVSLLH